MTNWPNSLSTMYAHAFLDMINAEIPVNSLNIFNFYQQMIIFQHKFLVRFKYAGQNLGQMKNSKKFPKPEVAIKTITKGWFSENINGNMNVIDSFQHLE